MRHLVVMKKASCISAVLRLASLCAGIVPLSVSADARIWLDETDLSLMIPGWGKSLAGKSIEGTPISLGGKTYEHGVGTHAVSSQILDVAGEVLSFDAVVGIDDDMLKYADRPTAPERSSKSSVKFIVFADGRVAAASPILREGERPYVLHADLKGAKTVELFVCDAQDGEQWDHADWCDAYFTVTDGTTLTARKVEVEQYGVLSPKPGPAPRINGPRVYGVRPGHDIIYRLPVSGTRPMAYSASNLPDGVRFDAKTGILSGSIATRGTYTVRFTAANAVGSATRDLDIVVGDRIALTPPMGWNSWNCFAGAVTAQNIRDTADVFDRSELANHGWSYVNVDDFWQIKLKTDDPTLKGPPRRPDGTITVNDRFKDMRALSDYIHAKGFRAGIYSSPGPYTCGGCVGSWKHEWQDARTFAEWGFDYLKYDWCGYEDVADSVEKDDVLMRNVLPYRLMGEALKAQDRDIVFSLCQYGMASVSTWGENVGGNSWRTTGDITDTWASMVGILERQAGLWPFARPGAWNDPDMLVLGKLGWGEALRQTRLSVNEQYTHMSMWCILCSPLLIGCDITQLDELTMSLLTNDEVLETNQDPLGAAAAKVAVDGQGEVWAKPMSDGSLVFALFNRGRFDRLEVSVDFAALGMEGEWRVRDLWRQCDVGLYAQRFSETILPHGTLLFRFFPTDRDARLRDGLADIRDNETYRAFEHARRVDKPGYRGTKPADDGCSGCPK